MREQPYCAAGSCSEGMRRPGGHSPATMRAWISATIYRCIGSGWAIESGGRWRRVMRASYAVQPPHGGAEAVDDAPALAMDTVGDEVGPRGPDVRDARFAREDPGVEDRIAVGGGP